VLLSLVMAGVFLVRLILLYEGNADFYRHLESLFAPFLTGCSGHSVEDESSGQTQSLKIALKRRNGVTREDVLLTATAPDGDEPRGAAAVEVACLHWPQWRAA
jgi:hypothetical protein